MTKASKNPTVEYCVRNNLCTGCGVCFDACPQTAITITRVKHFNAPVIDMSKCKNDKGCSRCFDVCAGHGINLEARNASLFEKENAHKDEVLGFYDACYVGYSCDKEIRYHAASGGCVSTLLIYLLEKGFIGGAIVTRFSEENPLKAEPFLAKTRDEILSAKSSKYCPVSMNGVVELVKNEKHPVAIVGLPCHIQSFRKYASVDKKFEKNVFIYIGLFCGSTQDYRAIDYIIRISRIRETDVKRFAYRDEGCLGSLKVEYSDGTIIKVPFLDYYKKLRSFFKPERCIACVDHFGKLADVSFGDIHIEPYKNDLIGTGSIITRGSKYSQLLKNADLYEYMEISDIDSTDIIKSQKILRYKRQLFVGNSMLKRIMKVPNAIYDTNKDQRASLVAVLRIVIYYCQRGIAKLWCRII